MTEQDVSALLSWYRTHKRALPWRDTGNPEDVWISEIMLQQTRVEAVKRYFTRFREALPDCAAIASCPEDTLMKLWEGLGYYSRARNIKRCAEVLLKEHGGHLPADLKELRKLPGIGPYTAGAIASLAFGIPAAAVDGNVLRVIARFEGDTADIALPETKERFGTMLSALILQLSGHSRERSCPPDEHDTGEHTADELAAGEHAESEHGAGEHAAAEVPGGKEAFSVSDFNQALMELGALVCLPNGAPLCVPDPSACPLSDTCKAFRSGRTDRIPVKGAKKARRVVQRTILVIRDGDRFLFRKRPAKGLLAGLYEFPGKDGSLTPEEAVSFVRSLGFEPLRISPLPDGTHIFTHVEWRMKAYEVRVSGFPAPETSEEGTADSAFFRLVPKAALSGMAVPSAFRTWTDWYRLKEEPAEQEDADHD